MLFLMGSATLIAFPLVGWLLTFVIPSSLGITFSSIFKIEGGYFVFIPLFLSIGILFGLFVIWLTELNYFEQAMKPYKDLLSNYNLTTFYVFFLSICAGVGEEVFFRGVIQPILGVWLTAFMFVAIHGYFSFKNKRINIFAILLTLFIAFIGWASKSYSIWLAISAHFSYDLVLLFYYKRTNAK